MASRLSPRLPIQPGRHPGQPIQPLEPSDPLERDVATALRIMHRHGWLGGAVSSRHYRFHFPDHHPHLDVEIRLGQVPSSKRTHVSDLAGIRPYISDIAMKWGHGDGTTKLYNRRRGGEELENHSYSVVKKARFESAVQQTIGHTINQDTALEMQRMLNELTGMGIELLPVAVPNAG